MFPLHFVAEPEKAGVYDKEIYDREVKEGYNGYNNEVSDVNSEIYSYEVPYNQQQPEYESVAKAGYDTYEVSQVPCYTHVVM